jgi:hypothetical protein
MVIQHKKVNSLNVLEVCKDFFLSSLGRLSFRNIRIRPRLKKSPPSHIKHPMLILNGIFEVWYAYQRW